MTLREIPYYICKDCQYYFGQADSCMVGEEDIPDNLERKCMTGKRANVIYCGGCKYFYKESSECMFRESKVPTNLEHECKILNKNKKEGER